MPLSIPSNSKESDSNAVVWLLALDGIGAGIYGVVVILLAFFFFNDTATTEIYTLSLHDALPISSHAWHGMRWGWTSRPPCSTRRERSEEHTSELQSQFHLVCRLLLEKKKKK